MPLSPMYDHAFGRYFRYSGRARLSESKHCSGEQERRRREYSIFEVQQSVTVNGAKS